MASFNNIWRTLLIFSSIYSVFCVENVNPDIYVFGFELLQERIDNLQLRYMELSVHVKEIKELFQANKQTIDQNQDKLNAIISMISDLSKENLDNPTTCANNDNVSKELQHSKENQEIFQHPDSKLTKSCREVNSTSSGLYEISGIDGAKPFTVLCQTTNKFGGGWMVFQRRFNGSVDFYRNWTEYRNGFGDAAGEFWLGLERLHLLTGESKWELLVEMEDFQENFNYALYSEFYIGNETEGYPLAKLGSYVGTAGDYLKYHKGMKFSTFDRDNDVDRRNCAQVHRGAWWYKNCLQSNLNGLHTSQKGYETIKWHAGFPSLKSTSMMIRPLD